MTLEDWTHMTNLIMDSNSPAFFGGLFMTIFVFMASYFLLNLILAVILTSFNEVENQMEEEEKQEALEEARERNSTPNKDRSISSASALPGGMPEVLRSEGVEQQALRDARDSARLKSSSRFENIDETLNDRE